MRIGCPYCGDRDSSEFSYLGATAGRRPDSAVADAAERFVDAIYMRDNPAGPNEELWYHAVGCRRWLEVIRDTRTHAIADVRFAGKAR